MTTRTSLGLKIVDDAGQAGAGIYIGGYQIAPDVLLIRADSFESAWQAMVDEFADAGTLTLVDLDDLDDLDPFELYDIIDDQGRHYTSDGTDWADGVGLVCTLDLTLRVVRPARLD